MLRRGLFILALLVASPCDAIVSNPLPRVCNEFPHSDYVFSGRVLSTSFRARRYIGGDSSNVYRIRVDRAFKGRLPHIVPLFTPADSGGGALDVGHRAVVFAIRSEGAIVFSGSSNSQSGAGVPKIISEIQDYLAHPPKRPTIAGRVDSWTTGPMAPFRNIRLLLSDGTNRKFVRTDSRGRFHAFVTPGSWSIRIAERSWASRTGIYSYDSAEKVRLAKGGCADIELETASPGEKLEGPDWKRWPS